LENLFQKLVDVVFNCDLPGVAGDLIVSGGGFTIHFYIEDGFIISSEIEGQSEPILDFLLSSNRITEDIYEEVKKQAEEKKIAPWVALLRGGWLTEEELEEWRSYLSAQHFSLVLSTGFDRVEFIAKKSSTVQNKSRWAAKPSLILLDYLHLSLHSRKIMPISFAPQTQFRPTERLKNYIGYISRLFQYGKEIPLPEPGGETFEEMEKKWGKEVGEFLSFLVISGMVRVDGVENGVEGKDGNGNLTILKIDRLFDLFGRMVSAEISEVMGNHEMSADECVEAGNILLSAFGAYDFANHYFSRGITLFPENYSANARHLFINLLGFSFDEGALQNLSNLVASLQTSREVKTTLLRNLSIHLFLKGNIREAVHCIHQAFIYKPYDFQNLVLLVRFLDSVGTFVLDASGTNGAEMESFGGSSYPAILPLAINCAVENGEFDLVSWIFAQAAEKVQISSQVLDRVVEVMRSKGWGTDLVELMTRFILMSDRRGWANPLWSLGALMSSKGMEKSIEFGREAYEILTRISSGKMWALSKLVEIAQSLNRPWTMLEILGRCFEWVSDPAQKESIGMQIAFLFEKEFGDTKNASEFASLVLEFNPLNESAIQLVLKGIKSGRVTLSACRRLVRAMEVLNISQNPQWITWVSEGAKTADEFLSMPGVAIRLIDKIIQFTEAGDDRAKLIDEKQKLEEKILRAKVDLQNLLVVFDRNKVPAVELLKREPENAKKLLLCILLTGEEKENILPLLLAMGKAGIFDWRNFTLSIVREDNNEKIVDFAEKFSFYLPDESKSAEDLSELDFFEELCNALPPEIILRNSKFEPYLKRLLEASSKIMSLGVRLISLLSQRASLTGDVESLMRLEERKTAYGLKTADRGMVYYTIASISDLDPEYEGKTSTFWKIAEENLGDYPPTIFRSIEDLLEKGDFVGAGLMLEANIDLIPKHLHPEIYEVVANLYQKGGESEGYVRSIENMAERFGWSGRVMQYLMNEIKAGKVDGKTGIMICKSIVKWCHFHSEIFECLKFALSEAQKNPSLRDEVVDILRTMINIPFPLEERDSSSRLLVETFFETAGDFLNEWGKYHDALGCFERSILLCEGKEEKIRKLFKIAHIYEEMGAQGIEGLIVALRRMKFLGVPASKSEEYFEFLSSVYGIDFSDENSVKGMFLRSSPDREASRLNLVTAGLISWVSGNIESGYRLALQYYRSNSNAHEVGIFAALLCESIEKWEDAVKLYREIAEKLEDKGASSFLFKRGALIMDVKLGKEVEASQMLLWSLECDPENQNLFEELKARAIKYSDKNLFIRIHEAVQGHLPGKETQKAFYFRYAKDMEEIFGDDEKASQILLQSLAVSPRKGPVLDGIVRLAIKMKQFAPVGQAISLLRSGGTGREEIGAFVVDVAKKFMENGNVNSAYSLINECIEKDPGIDVVEGVRLFTVQGPSGVLLARKLLDKWIDSLEDAISTKQEDQDYIKRIDEISDFRDTLIEISASDEDMRKTIPPGSVPPPSMDRFWDDMEEVSEKVSEDEVTYEMFPQVDIVSTRLMKEKLFSAPPIVDVEKVEKIDEEKRSEKKDVELKEVPKVIVDLTAGQEEEGKSIDVVSKIEQATERLFGEALELEERKQDGVKADAIPHKRERADSISVEVTVLSTEKGFGVESRVEELEKVPEKSTPSSIEEALSSVPPPPKKEEEKGVEIEKFLPGDRSVLEFCEQPWKLEMIPPILQMNPQCFSNRSTLFLLRGIYSLFNSGEAKFSQTDYKLIGKEGTTKNFSNLVVNDEERKEKFFEVLELLWDYFPSLSIERIQDYGVTVADQITPFSPGPVAPVIERAIRALGYIRAVFYCKRERKMELRAVRTNPPSVVILLPLGKIPASLDYFIGKVLWSVSSRRILACTLPVEEGEKILEAMTFAFGKHSRKEKMDPIVSSIVQDAWQIIPHRIQERLRGIVMGLEKTDFSILKKIGDMECIKTGFLFSGDIATAVREFLPGDLLSSIEGDIPLELLSRVVKESEEMQRFLRFALSFDVRKFMDEFLV